MALSHKDWELPNSWIWLAEIDIESDLDFPISTGHGIYTASVSQWKRCKLKCKIIDYFHLPIFISVNTKKLTRKKNNEQEQTLEKLNLDYRHSKNQLQ